MNLSDVPFNRMTREESRQISDQIAARPLSRGPATEPPKVPVPFHVVWKGINYVSGTMKPSVETVHRTIVRPWEYGVHTYGRAPSDHDTWAMMAQAEEFDGVQMYTTVEVLHVIEGGTVHVFNPSTDDDIADLGRPD